MFSHRQRTTEAAFFNLSAVTSPVMFTGRKRARQSTEEYSIFLHIFFIYSFVSSGVEHDQS